MNVFLLLHGDNQAKRVFCGPSNILQCDEAKQRLGVQQPTVRLSWTLGAEQQDGGKAVDWLEGDWNGVDRLSSAQVGPLGTVHHGHLDLRT